MSLVCPPKKKIFSVDSMSIGSSNTSTLTLDLNKIIYLQVGPQWSFGVFSFVKEYKKNFLTNVSIRFFSIVFKMFLDILAYFYGEIFLSKIICINLYFLSIQMYILNLSSFLYFYMLIFFTYTMKVLYLFFLWCLKLIPGFVLKYCPCQDLGIICETGTQI